MYKRNRSWRPVRTHVKETRGALSVHHHWHTSMDYLSMCENLKQDGPYPNVIQASRTTWDRRSLADSLKAPSKRRKCWKKLSYSAAPAKSKDLIFFSWWDGENEEIHTILKIGHKKQSHQTWEINIKVNRYQKFSQKNSSNSASATILSRSTYHK